MLNKKKAISSIHEQLMSVLDLNDFKFDRKEDLFIKNTPENFFIFDLHFYDRTLIKTGEKGILIEPYIWIHSKKIEEIYKDFTTNKELKKDIDFYTVGESIAELKANPDGIHKKWNQTSDIILFNESQLKSVVEELKKQFKNFALAYFKKNSKISSIDVLLNRNPTEYCVHMTNDLLRYVKGLIAAKLNNNPNVEMLANLYTSLVAEKNMPLNAKLEMESVVSILPVINL